MVTNFSSSESIVIQIHPTSHAGAVTVKGTTVNRKDIWLYIPKQDGTQIFCPFNYFQDSCSLAEEWIYDNDRQKIHLDGISQLRKVIFTTDVSGQEDEITFPEGLSSRLLAYFKDHFSSSDGFDCHAFVCFLVDTICVPEAPKFSWSEMEPNIGDIVCLSAEGDLPNSIKHWAIFLGDDMYMSKFGESSGHTDSHVDIMNIENMHSLYQTKNMKVASALAGAEKWNGKFIRTLSL